MTQDAQGTGSQEMDDVKAACPLGAPHSISVADVEEPEETVDTAVARVEPAPSASEIFEPVDANDPAIVRKLNKWAQGCLVPGTRLFWGGPDGLDVLTGGKQDGSEPGSWSVRQYEEPTEGESVPADSSGRRLGIITSQTCDVILSGVGARHPVVQVSPVVRADDHFRNQLNEIRLGMIGYLVVLDNVPESPDGTYEPETAQLAAGTWVADLRISLPVSKAVLLRTKARSAFSSEKAALDFAATCAIKTRRPSWHEDIADIFQKEINKAIEAARKEGDEAWLGPVEQVRLELIAGTKLEPTKVAPLVLYDSNCPVEFRERWIDMLREAGSKTSRKIDVITAKFHDLSEMPATVYRGTDPLWLPSLGRPSYW